MKAIYLDYNATTPIDPEVCQIMRPYLDTYFGNPSSSHAYGAICSNAIERSRTHLANMLSCSTREIVFTSGGSESNNYALKGYVFANSDKGKHIITSSIEHPAVLEVCEFLQENGFDITYLPVDNTGRVVVSEFEKAIRPDTILVSIMMANNEIGTIQPIKEIVEIAHQHGVVVHSDAAQAVGKIDVNVADLGVDLLSIASHKFYGPKGIGALYVREGICLQKLIHGANHESNRRAGTENVLEIVGMGKAAELVIRNLDKDYAHSNQMINLLYKQLNSNISDLRINGNADHRLPNTLSISLKGINSNKLLSKIPLLAVSTGAACKSDSDKSSKTLMQIDIPKSYEHGTIRLSVGRFTTKKEIDIAVSLILSAM